MFVRRKHVPFFKKAHGNRPFRNGEEGGGAGASGGDQVAPPAPSAVTTPTPPAAKTPAAPATPPPTPPAPPATTKDPKADPGDDPRLNALSAQVKEMADLLRAKEAREAELAEKVARADAQVKTTKLYGDLGYSDNPKAQAVLNELIANRTFFRDGVQYWRTEDGKSLTMEQGLKEFQKDLGSLFLRDMSRPISQTRQPAPQSPPNSNPNQPRPFGGQRKTTTIAQAAGKFRG